MQAYFQRRPLHLYSGLVFGLLAFGVVARPIVEAFAPGLSMMGIRVTINWTFVALVVALVAWLGWWDRIRLTSSIDAGGRKYLLLLAALIVAPFVAAVLAVPGWFAVPEWSFFDGQPLSDAGVALMVVVGIALGAAISEELLYRGVVLRSLESRGRVQAALGSSFLFGAAHLSLLVVDVPVTEVLVVAVSSALVAVGLAAITFRIGTLWPLVVWHFLQDVGPSFLSGEALAVYALAYAVLALGLVVLGLWLLWSDRDVTVVDPDPVEGTVG